MSTHKAIMRAPAEQNYEAELQRLADTDTAERPTGWKLSPRAVRRFIIGDSALAVTRKFYGDDALIDRCIVTLMSHRGLLLVGEPGTAKSMLSELLAAAISGDSTCTIQGTSGSSEDQIKYGWNYALLLAEGPTERAMVPGPMVRAMRSGAICRFEELTRVQPEIADCLISLLSDKLLLVPELTQPCLFAAPGFNVIATANIRDRGVHEMSSALKRRFNFETVKPINDRQLEIQLIRAQTQALLDEAGVALTLEQDVIALLVHTFADLRSGKSAEGLVLERPTAVMSSAEAVAVGFAAALDAFYFADGDLNGSHIGKQLIGTVMKDQPEDGAKLRHYFDVVVKQRARSAPQWAQLLKARELL